MVVVDLLSLLTDNTIDTSVLFESIFDFANERNLEFVLPSIAHAVTISQDLKRSTDQTNAGNGIVWESAMLLALFLDVNVIGGARSRQSPLRILDISSGCGLLGISLAKMNCAVTMTEQPSVLLHLHENISKNSPYLYAPQVCPLFWGNIDQIAHVRQNGPFDIIVATDVTFSYSLIPLLVETLRACADQNTEMYICAPEREPNAFQLFSTTVKEQFSANIVTFEGPLQRANELECPLFLLTLKPQHQ
eukprot:c7709_g1_i1.p1 GENE.c7709_g1_i1~~c7709_g1_i1.p1  ORF type:complete len:248 (+),score=56.70 c7709_g1_i1:64-807(+)